MVIGSQLHCIFIQYLTVERLRGDLGDHRMELILAELEVYLEEVDLTLQERDTIARILERLRDEVTAL